MENEITIRLIARRVRGRCVNISLGPKAQLVLVNYA